jgi:hypothetical protein
LFLLWLVIILLLTPMLAEGAVEPLGFADHSITVEARTAGDTPGSTVCRQPMLAHGPAPPVPLPQTVTTRARLAPITAPATGAVFVCPEGQQGQK